MKNRIEKERAKAQRREDSHNNKLKKAWSFWSPRYLKLKDLFEVMWGEFEKLEDGTDWVAEEGTYAEDKKYIGINGYGFEFNIRIEEYKSRDKVSFNNKKIYLTYNSGCTGIGDGRDLGHKDPFYLPRDILKADKPEGVFYMVEKMKNPNQGGDTISLFMRNQKGEVVESKSKEYLLSPRLNVQRVVKDFWSFFD